MSRIAIVRNPRSGRGRGTTVWPKVEQMLRTCLGSRLHHVEETTASGSAREQARRLALEGYEVIAASGGDGTVSQVMQGLLGTPTALAIIPLGTGNDFARTIAVGPDPRLAVQALAKGRRQRVDLGHWRSGDSEGHFLNVAGCGFDAAVADCVNTGIRHARGQLAYLIAIWKTLKSYRPTELRMVVDGRESSSRAMLCAIANAKSYGGGMKIAPQASITDGLLDLVVVGDFRRMEFLRAFPRVLKGTHLSHPKVSHRAARRIEIESDAPVPFLVDGELIPPGKVSVGVVPAAIEVVVGTQWAG